MEKLFILGLCIGVVGLLTSTIYMGMVMFAVVRFRRETSPAEATEFTPAVSLLKPLHGGEPGLAEHLATFFDQDYPCFEILFCARHEEDAGLAIARSIAARYPRVSAQFLTSGEPTAPNAKILSLERMSLAARHEILIISDSDVRVERNYIREVAAPFAADKVGAVTCLYRGVAAEGGLWSRIEAAAMSIEMTAGVLVADMLQGMDFALGPTMAVRRSCLAEIGGFLPMANYCSDDFLLGNWVAGRGHTVILSHHVIDHVVLHDSFVASMRHQARWMKSTRFSRPKGHFGTVLTFSVPFGIVAALAAAAMHHLELAAWLLVASVATRMLMAAVVSHEVLQEKSKWQSVLLYPIRDLFAIFFWLASYGSRKILWRNEVYVLEKDGRMQATKT
jgi:ceramide glucosyltransferase